MFGEQAGDQGRCQAIAASRGQSEDHAAKAQHGLVEYSGRGLNGLMGLMGLQPILCLTGGAIWLGFLFWRLSAARLVQSVEAVGQLRSAPSALRCSARSVAPLSRRLRNARCVATNFSGIGTPLPVAARLQRENSKTRKLEKSQAGVGGSWLAGWLAGYAESELCRGGPGQPLRPTLPSRFQRATHGAPAPWFSHYSGPANRLSHAAQKVVAPESDHIGANRRHSSPPPRSVRLALPPSLSLTHKTQSRKQHNRNHRAVAAEACLHRT